MINWKDLGPVNEELMARIKTEFEKAGSDKVNHGYEHAYQYFFSKIAPKSLLEIGLANYAPLLGTHGANSMFIWPRLFPGCLVYGADLQEDRLFDSPRTDHPGPTVPEDLDKSKLKTFVVDQASPESLAKFYKDLGSTTFDVIIDDASHNFAYCKQTFEVLFPKLKRPGFYFIEDVARTVREPQQNVGDWNEYLRGKIGFLYSAIIDAKPNVPEDQDSVIVAIWKI
jgi:hypothetical protein